jgi:hypothetical protein
VKTFYKQYFWIIIGVLCISAALPAQSKLTMPQSTEIDTTRLFSDEPVKSPTGAALRSALLPGWGQLYNQKPYKAVFFFSVNAYLVYQIISNDHQFDKTGKRFYKRRRDNHSWYFGLSYLLTLMDAYVDAYLFGFEKVMKVRPMPVVDDGVGVLLNMSVRF